MIRHVLTAGVLVLALATPAFAADEGSAQDELKAKIKKKMEEIRRLMAENEKALLELSTGSDGKPRRVDVDVPDQPGGASQGGSDKSGASGSDDGADKGSASGAPSGEDIARRLRELIQGQRGQGQRIPQEIEQLLKMIPSSQGQGQGPPQQDKPKPGEDKQPQSLRDARKQLDEQQQNQKPERGDESNPANQDKMRARPEDPEKAKDTARKDDVPAWFTALPPEIRDALAGGQAEKIPAKYRDLITRYNLYLQKKASERGR